MKMGKPPFTLDILERIIEKELPLNRGELIAALKKAEDMRLYYLLAQDPVVYRWNKVAKALKKRLENL